jgi:hypothetical protein
MRRRDDRRLRLQCQVRVRRPRHQVVREGEVPRRVSSRSSSGNARAAPPRCC